MLPPTFIASLIAIGVLLVLILTYVLVSREVERRRLDRERAIAAQRKKELLATEVDEPAVPASISKSEHQEMIENAQAMVKEDPERAAKLVRHWLDDGDR